MRNFIRRSRGKTEAPEKKKKDFLLVIATAGMLILASPVVSPAIAGWCGSDAGIIAAIMEEVAKAVAMIFSINTMSDNVVGVAATVGKSTINANTKLTQAQIDAANKLFLAGKYVDIAWLKNTATKEVEQYCIEMHASRMDQDLGGWRDTLVGWLSEHPYKFGSLAASNCFQTAGGHSVSGSSSVSGNCQGGTQAMVDRLKIGCAIGALDRWDLAGTTIAGTSCDTTVSKAFNDARSLGTSPETPFLTSMYLTSGETPTGVKAYNKADPGIKERLFQIQMFYCQSLRGNVAQSPVGKEVNTPGGSKLFNDISLGESFHRSKEQVCLDAVADHAQIPCNGKASGSFESICTELQKQCNNFKSLIDTSIYSGCSDGSGSMSPQEIREMLSRKCANPTAQQNGASGSTVSVPMTMSALRACDEARSAAMRNERNVKINIKAAMMRSSN